MKKFISLSLVLIFLFSTFPVLAQPGQDENKTSPGVTQTATEEPTRQPSTTPAAPDDDGLGTSREDAAKMYQLFGFTFAEKFDEKKQPYYEGTKDDLAVVRFFGPPENIIKATLDITISNPPTKTETSRTLFYLAALLAVGARDWDEGVTWLKDNLDNSGVTKTSFENKDVVLNIKQEEKKTVIQFSITQKERGE